MIKPGSAVRAEQTQVELKAERKLPFGSTQ